MNSSQIGHVDDKIWLFLFLFISKKKPQNIIENKKRANQQTDAANFYLK
jgi:hypothetical protein